MRELERIADHRHPALRRAAPAVAIGGAGRMGSALATSLSEAGYDVGEPLRRGEIPSGAHAVLLCVPDAEIAAAAEAVAGSAAFVGHTSGATPLSVLGPARAPAFGLHPLQSVTGTTRFEGC